MGQTSPLPQGFNTGGRELEQLGAEDILRIGFDRWGRDLVLCTSLQSEGMVLLDMSLRLRPDLRVFTIDTGRLPEETHEFIAQVRRHYGIQFEVYSPDAEEVSRLVTVRGVNAFRETAMDRQACCHIRKVRPLDAVLSGKYGSNPAAFVVGLRRGQNPTRATTPKLGPDPQHPGIWKLAPLADWTPKQVEEYTQRHGVPRHPLYAQGYRSLGCAPCTRAISTDEHERSGRWWWEADAAKECGLHYTVDGRLRRGLDVVLEQVLEPASVGV